MDPQIPTQNTEHRRQASDEAISSDRRLLFPVAVLGVLAIVFGFYRIYGRIYKPFEQTSATANTNGAISTLAALANKDTDSDGLSDFDELYKYKTSPYLADSDGDGVSDKNEIANGTDPNCPGKQVCTAIAQSANVNTNSTSNANIGDLLNNADATNASAEPGGSSQLSAAQLRQVLKDAGAPAATIDGLDDATLIAYYQDVLGTKGSATGNTNSSNTNSANANTSVQGGNSNANVSAPTNNANSNSTPNSSSLNGLTADQIRTLLIQGGADAATLNSVDDATLQAIFAESLQNLGTNTNTSK